MASAKAVSAIRVQPARVNLAHGERQVRGRHELAGAEEHGAVGVEAFGVLARDHQVDRRPAARRKAAAALRRTDIGVEIEQLAQAARRIAAALLHRRVGIVVDRPEDHAVGRPRRLDRRIRQRGALRPQRHEPDRDRRERKAELADPVRGSHDLHGGRGDLRPDTVALHDDEPDRCGGRGGHV
jgi:hypothetical protein